MGVAVSTFIFSAGLEPEQQQHIRNDFDRINETLTKDGQPPHEEPESKPSGVRRRERVDSFPMDCMYRLVRVYAAIERRRSEKLDYTIVPFDDEDIGMIDSWMHELIEDGCASDDNLIAHALHTGYLLPIQGQYPLFCDMRVAGNGVVGSTSGLLAELRTIAPVIGIDLDDEGNLGDEEHAKVWAACNGGDPWSIEKTAWLTLFENAVTSLKYGTAIVFT